MTEYGANDGPLGKAPDISIGASDAVLLAVSTVGFLMLAVSVYKIVLAKLKTAEELELEAQEKEISYGERLAQADVSTLNRAQRRARAKHIMKQQRRLGGGSDTGENNNMNINNDMAIVPHEQEQGHDENIPAFRADNHLHANSQHLLSRKERQKAAKQVELQERRLLEEDRRNEQKKAQEAAVARRKAKELQQKIQAGKDKKERMERQQANEMARYKTWQTFIETHGDDSITVKEWIKELKHNRIVYLKDLAVRFSVEETSICERIQELLDTNRLSGILEKPVDDDGDESNKSVRFIYLSPENMAELATFVKGQDHFTARDFAKHISEELPNMLRLSVE